MMLCIVYMTVYRLPTSGSYPYNYRKLHTCDRAMFNQQPYQKCGQRQPGTICLAGPAYYLPVQGRLACEPASADTTVDPSYIPS
jgi:hypothetical protein